MSVVIGVDVGGTKVVAAEVSAEGEVLRVARRMTPGRRVEVELVEDALTQAVEEVAAGRRVAGVGLAAAGFVDAAGERVMFAPHLPWHGEQVRARLTERWQVPVFLDNDANCAARAETAYGAAVGARDALVVTLGTGIGGAVVLGRQLHRGRNGMAGEFGHMQVVPGGNACECGNLGCWEQYASGRVLGRRAAAAVAEGSPIGRRLVEAAGGPERVEGAHVTPLAESGDEEAIAWIAEVGDWLGVGMANLAAALDPGLFVVGGGVSDAGEMLLGPAREAYSRTLTGRGYRSEARIVRAHLGPEAGLIGAADMARLTARRRRPANPAARVRVRAAARSGRSPKRRR